MRIAALLVVVMIAAPVRADDPPRTQRGEVIIIDDAPPQPAVQARPKVRRWLAPAYSDRAIETDAWAIAWMLLDIDRTGTVTRVKFLRRPGYDLERTAIKTAFALRFEPAVDAHGRPQRTLVIYPIEWPSYWWLVAHTGFSTAIPLSARAVPCRGSAPLNLDLHHAVYRDCSRPDLSPAHVRAEPWFTAVPPAPR